MTAILGYARASTIVENLDARLGALSTAGVDPARVFTASAGKTRFRLSRTAVAARHQREASTRYYASIFRNTPIYAATPSNDSDSMRQVDYIRSE
jgi:hypothetical protein